MSEFIDTEPCDRLATCPVLLRPTIVGSSIPVTPKGIEQVKKRDELMEGPTLMKMLHVFVAFSYQISRV